MLPSQFSVWSSETENLHSQYGFVTYLEWCKREADRVGRLGRTLFVWRENGDCCLHKKPQILA